MRIRDLTYKGWANKIPGRHIFRIDERIMSGNCFDDESKNLIFAFRIQDKMRDSDGFSSGI